MTPRHATFAATVVLALAAGAPAAAQELGIRAGRDVRWFSDIRYRGYRTAGVTLLFPDAIVTRPRSGLGVEIRLGYEWGHGIPITRDQATDEEWAAFAARGVAPTIDVHSWLAAVTPIWRQRVGSRLDWEGGIGASWLGRPLLTGGTRWNVLLVLGAGLRLAGPRGTPDRVALRAEHFSNGGKIGITDARVIGLESLTLLASWKLH